MNPTNEPIRSSPQRHRKRLPNQGLVLMEVVVAAGVVLTMLSIAAPIMIRSARLWKQTRHQQFASDELSGQMDRLIALPASERIAALETLTVSSEVRQVLHDAVVGGKQISDQDGVRIELTIQWDRIDDAAPVTLVAWVDPWPQRTTTTTEPTTTEPTTETTGGAP